MVQSLRARLSIVIAAALVLASCSSGSESSAVVADLQKQHELKIQRLFGRPELRSYLMLPLSFVGGTCPLGTAALLREVQQLEATYLSALTASSASHSVVQAHRTFEDFARQVAELYELM